MTAARNQTCVKNHRRGTTVQDAFATPRGNVAAIRGRWLCKRPEEPVEPVVSQYLRFGVGRDLKVEGSNYSRVHLRPLGLIRQAPASVTQ